MLPGLGGNADSGGSLIRLSLRYVLPERMRLRPDWGWGERNHAARTHARAPGRASETNIRVPRIPNRRPNFAFAFDTGTVAATYIHISSSGHQMTRICHNDAYIHVPYSTSTCTTSKNTDSAFPPAASKSESRARGLTWPLSQLQAHTPKSSVCTVCI